jgi:hypothetical protein
MIRLRSTALLMGVACTLGMFTFEARGGPLTITVTESGPGGSTPVSITDNGLFDLDMRLGFINVDTGSGASQPAGINLSLKNYQFGSLSANSNSISNIPPGTGLLTQNGVVQLLAGGIGSITVVATDNAYNQPPPGPGILHTSSTAEFANATNGNTSTFQGWYNSNNALGGFGAPPSPLTTFTASGQPASDPHMGQTNTAVTLVNPYGLTSQSVITLTGGAQAQDRFGGTVQTLSIPEPASMALMLGALPVLVFGLMRRRRAAA